MFFCHPFFIFFCLLLTLISENKALSLDEDDEEVERGDKFIDDLLTEMLHEKGHEYDPYILEDHRAEFNKKVMFVNVTAEAKLHNGYILGLISLHRPFHCLLEEIGNKLMVSAELGAGILNFHYDGTVKFMGYGLTISASGELSYVETHMEFMVDAKTGRNGELTKFYIDEMKGMKIEISGLGPFNWAWNYMINWTTSLFKGYLRSFIENKVRNHIADRLPHYQFPVTGVNVTDLLKPEPQPEPEVEQQLESRLGSEFKQNNRLK